MKLPGKPLIRAARIQTRVRALAGELSRHYGEKPLTVVGLMNGSIFFLVDLLRFMPPDTQVECWRVTSYRGKKTTGKLEGLEHCRGDFKGRHILIIDDILDSGVTLHYVKKHIQKLGAKSIRVCVLLDKKKKRLKRIKSDWSGFQIADEFVVGYGLDLDGRYRSLKEIRTLS